MTMNTVADRMEIIKTVFQDAKDYASEQDDTKELVRHLENANPQFRSVAYEGASMGLALKDFSDDAPHSNIPSFQHSILPLNRWNSFMNASKNHAAHVCVGLGWAIAQERTAAPPQPSPLGREKAIQVLPNGEDLGGTLMQFRIWDGCGYYDGFFRQRQTIQNQSRLDYIPEKYFQGYDQGMGRCLWYLCKGDENKIPAMIQKFLSPRHPDLWRGVGIACAYVGGCDESILKTLSASAGSYNLQLGIGVAMAAKARVHANSATADIELACQVLCNLSAHEATRIIVKTETSSGGSFPDWLLQMETEIVQSKK